MLLDDVRPDDDAYLRNMFRPAGAYNLVELDLATDRLSAKVVGQYDWYYHGWWLSADGVWLSERTLKLTFADMQ